MRRTAWRGGNDRETEAFHSRSVFVENLIVEMRKLEVKFDKPIYVLDISKVCLYEFHHEYLSPMYRDKCKIMSLTRTVSFTI